MPDIAKLGFSVPTGPLEKAKAALQQIVPAAKNAEKATDGYNRSVDGLPGLTSRAAAGTAVLTSKLGAAASGINATTRATALAGTAMGTVQTSAQGAAVGLDRLGVRAAAGAVATQKQTNELRQLQSELTGVVPAANQAGSALDRLGASANDNINRLQSTPGNVAAQFQDIGVTAAAGMNPLLIALQQGTQLSAAMSGGIGTLFAGIKQLLSPVNILTIAFVGLVAALIQYVMNAVSATKETDALGDSLEDAARSADFFGNAQSQLGAIFDSTTGKMQSQNAVLVQTIKLQQQYLLLQSQITRSDLTKSLLGRGQISLWDKIINSMASGSMAMENAGDASKFYSDNVKELKERLAPLRNVLSGFAIAINDTKLTTEGLNGATEKVISNIDALAASGKIAKGEVIGLKEEILQLAIARGQEFAATDALSSIASGQLTGNLTPVPKADKASKPKASKPKASKPKAEKDPWKELLRDADRAKRGLEQAAATVGVYGEELARMTYEQDLFNAAQDDGIKLIGDMSDELKKRAAEMAKLDEQNRIAQFIEDQAESTRMLNAELERERGEIGLTKRELIAYQYVTEALLEAKRQHIELSPEYIRALQQEAEAYAAQRTEIDETKESLKFARETTKGFFEEWINGIRRGEGFWDSFVKAVVNGLNRIIDRLIDKVLEDALDRLFGGNKGGGLLSTIGSVLGGLGRGGGNKVSLGAVAGLRAAHGEAFAAGGIVNQPTMFSYAGGNTRTGLMGEAGPEAVMPLTRGRDGRLGVRMYHNDNQNAQQVEVVILPSEYFDAVVDKRATSVATPIAVQSAVVSSEMTEQRMGQRAQRRIPA